MHLLPANFCFILAIMVCIYAGPSPSQGRYNSQLKLLNISFPGWSVYKREHIPSDQELMEYINSMRGQGQQYYDPDMIGEI